MSESGSNLDSSSGNQVKDIINAYLERRSTDPNTTPESLISKHPQHAELLRHEFEILKFIDQAHGAFANEPKDASSGSFRDTNHWVHCPHCRYQFEVDTQTEHASVNCSSCGQNVSIYSRQGTRASSNRPIRSELARVP